MKRDLVGYRPALRSAICLTLALIWAGDNGTALAQQAIATGSPAAIGGETLLRGDFAKAFDSLSRELEANDLSNDKRAALLNDRGVAQWRIGALKPALDDLNKAATIYPEFASTYNNRGNVLLALQAPAEAVKDFERAILLSPGYAAAYNNRAIAQMQLGNLDAAIADFSKATELAPNAPAPINGRGRVHLESGRPFLALRDFSRSIALDPGYRPGYRNRALGRMALRQYAVAIEDLNNALTFAPNDPGLLLTRGTAAIAAQSYGPALLDLDKLVGLTPGSAAAFAERGRAKALMGSFPEAMADFAKAIEIDPKNRDAFIYRAEAHQLNNEPDLGLADAERALKIDQSLGLAFRVRGRIEEALGQKTEAAADFEQAARLDIDDPEAWAGLQRLTGKTRTDPTELEDTRLDSWAIGKDGDRLFARNDRLPGLLVPLELLNGNSARLTGYEEKPGQFKGIGVLRYSAGSSADKSGAKEIELAAIIDLTHKQLLGIEPYREGETLAGWTWADTGDLSVKGPDGVSSVYHLALALDPVAPTIVSSARQQQRAQAPRRQASASQPTHKKKSFTLFDLLFN